MVTKQKNKRSARYVPAEILHREQLQYTYRINPLLPVTISLNPDED